MPDPFPTAPCDTRHPPGNRLSRTHGILVGDGMHRTAGASTMVSAQKK